MLHGFRALATIGLILSLPVLSGCAVVTPVPAASASQQVTPYATTAPAATGASPTAAPAAATTALTPVPSSTPAAAPTLRATAAVGGVIASSPVAAGSSPPLTSITQVPSTGGVAPVPGPDGQITVTLANNGATLKLHSGERFVMMLGETYNWQVTPADQTVVSRVINITPIRGSQGVYEAHKAGQTTIEASGDPQCRQSQPPCMMPSILFSLNVVVQ